MTVVELREHLDESYTRLLEASHGLEMLEGFVAPRPSLEERLAAGKAIRERVPRSSHAFFETRLDRPDPVSILEEQSLGRVKKLVPVRYARMLASPFAFLRGSAAVMAEDLSHTPVTGLPVVACGDMHVANFGLYASAERNLVFAINDFDEVHPGPWEWDLKRLAASAAVASRFLGGGDAHADEAARRVVGAYRRRIRRYAGMGHLKTWYDRIDEPVILDAAAPRARKKAEQLMRKARENGPLRTLEKLTEHVDGVPRIVEDAPLIVHETHLEDGMPIEVALDNTLRTYVHSLPDALKFLLSRYRIVDFARKVVGVGSVGTACWVILLQGVDGDDPLFLQVKQAQASVLAPYVDVGTPFGNQGRRVVVGQRLTQGSPDIFLGWGENDGGYFYVRQLADMKGGIRFAEGEKDVLGGYAEYCALCGWALALAHAKSGDPAKIAGYCGKSEALDDAISRFALAYVEQTDRDHDALERARRSGRIPVDATVK